MQRLARQAALGLAVIGLGSSAAQAGVIVGGSALLTSAYEAQLETWLGQGPLILTNIYTYQSGDTSATFHAAVDGKGPTFSVLEVLPGTYAAHRCCYPQVSEVIGNAEIIGGYDPLSWDNGGYHIIANPADRTAFIFNLTDSLLQPEITSSSVGEYQTYDSSTYGPTFGGGHDIYVDSSLTGGYADDYSYSPLYSGNILGNGNYYTENLVYGALEVFSISPEVPEPGSLALFGAALAGLGIVRRRTLHRFRRSST